MHPLKSSEQMINSYSTVKFTKEVCDVRTLERASEVDVFFPKYVPLARWHCGWISCGCVCYTTV